MNNVNTRALFELGDAAAHATLTLARSREGFFEDGSRQAQQRTAVKKAPAQKGHLVPR